jgi:signal transduction histidine kinase
VAATESEPGPARRRSRWTLRIRLTLLYGACFLAAGAGLLAINDGLYASSQTAQVTLHGGAALKVPGPLAALQILTSIRPAHGTLSGSGSQAQIAISSGGQVTRAHPPSKQLIQAIKTFSRGAQRQISGLTRQANFVLARQKQTSLSSLETKSWIALGIMTLVSIVLGWLVAGRALVPLRVMNRRARAITEDNLHERLGVSTRRDELGELAASFDELLARLERAFESQRQFVANASHELRTPLTLERALMELALADPEPSVESMRHAVERVLASNQQQERLIEALLTLARGQAGAGSSDRVDLAAVVAEELALRQTRFDAAEIKVRGQLGEAEAVGDPALLTRAVANLLENALVHNVSGGWVEVETRTVDGSAVLRVANGGEMVPAERVAELTEPFRRLAGERTGTGLGIGLSIVASIARAHNAELRLTALDGGGLEVNLTVPAALPPGSVHAPL